ncbi:MAG: TonB-dependent receptor, partial [Bacteroidota bacterium]
MKKLVRMILALVMAAGVATGAFAQGSTTASIAGSVKDEAGEALTGANVVVTHKPTGAKYGNMANESGRFRIPNVQVGGPYKVEVSFVGYETTTKDGVYLTLGQTLNMIFILKEEATQLDGIEIVAENGVFDGNQTGAQTVVDEATINSMPTVSRALGDFARLNPQVTLDEGNDGLEISIGGQNNRFNTIYIDGAVNNDVFGLAASGTNGGQTGVSPISIDAIQQLQVSVAPFDVRQSGFAGGAINAVTRSGTNEFEGSVYYFFQNDGLAGNNPFNDEPLDDFTAQTFGARLGGPIVKDKLFFFANVEIQRDETPLPFDFSLYEGDATREDLNRLEQKLAGFGYDPGGFENNASSLNSDKFLFKLDWNVSDKHKLTARYSLTTAENLERVQSGRTFIGYQNSAEYFESATHSAALELRSSINQNMSNHFIFGFTAVRDDRDPFGNPFPFVEIDNGSGSIEFGSEPFSTANRLDQDVITFTNNFELYKGNHAITIGANLELFRAANLFIRQNFGAYEYSSLEAFLNDEPADAYFRSFSQVDNIAGDESAAIAEFNTALFGFYVQDEIQVNDNFKFTAGLRLDMPIYSTDIPVNESFNNETIPLIESFGYDLQGAQTGESISTQLQFAPRLGFNWDVTGDQDLQVRGGLGIFTSRAPLVWVGCSYNNYGFNVGGIARFGSQTFVADPFNQPGGIEPGEVVEPSGQIDLFADNFKLPQVLKASVAVDKKLPWGLIATAEYLYTKTIQDISVDNVNLKPSTENLTGTPDDSNIYDRRDEIEPDYTRVMLASNTSEGYAHTFMLQLQKPFDNGFLASVAYNYTDAWSVFDATSSQNSSQWRNLHTVNGRNDFDQAQRSTFASGGRVMAQASYRFDWEKVNLPFMATQVGIFYNGQASNPYSYIYNDRGGLTSEDSREQSLVYVPASQGDIILVESRGISPQDQWNNLNSFIESDDYLSSIRGEYAERNQSRGPFQHSLDLRFLQDFYIKTGNKRNTLQFTADIFNVLNFINSDWGRIELFPSRFGNYELLNFEGRRPLAPPQRPDPSRACRQAGGQRR